MHCFSRAVQWHRPASGSPNTQHARGRGASPCSKYRLSLTWWPGSPRSMPEAGEPICELLPDAVPPPGERDTAVQGCAAAYTAVQGCAAAYTPRYTRACCTAMFSPSLCLPLRHHGADRVCLSSAGRPRTPSSNHIPCMLYIMLYMPSVAHLCTQHTCVHLRFCDHSGAAGCPSLGRRAGDDDARRPDASAPSDDPVRTRGQRRRRRRRR